MKQKHTKYTDINTNESTHSEMGAKCDKTQSRELRTSDRMIQPPLFRRWTSNCTNLFRPEPNRTRYRIFAFVRLLFGNL